jgi:cytochrome P450
VDFNFADFDGVERDVHAAWRVLHEGPDIFWTPRNGGHWVATRAKLIEAILKDHDTFSSRSIAIPTGISPLEMLPIEADPPRHADFRSLLAPWFTPKAVNDMRGSVQQLTIELIEGFIARGQCEFVDEFAKRLPILIFLRLVDLPLADREKLLHWTETAVRSKNPLKKLWVFLRVNNYIEGWIIRRRKQPGNDLFSAIVGAEVFGRPIQHAEIQGMITVILFGGLDTVASMLGFMAKFLAEHPQHRRQLVEHPERIPGAVDEMMRLHGIVNLARYVTRDVEFDGVKLKKGDMIQIPNGLSGVDERFVANPLEVNFAREAGARQHAAFGLGIHRCIGSFLAKAELTVFLEEWLKRIPEFEIADRSRVHTGSGQVNGVLELPLRWPV